METLRVSLPSPYPAAMAWSRCWMSVCWNTQVSKINTIPSDLCEREVPFILSHDLIWHFDPSAMTRLIWCYDRAHLALWLGSSGTWVLQPGLIWHYDPGSSCTQLSSGWACTARFASFHNLEAGFALPQWHHSTIWRLWVALLHLHCLQSGGLVCTAAFTSFYNLEAGFALPHLHHSTIWRLDLHCHIYIVYNLEAGFALPHLHRFTIWRLGLHCCIHIILQSGPDLNQKFRNIIVLNASSVCHTSRQMTCSEMRSMLSLTKAQPSTAGISLRMVKCKRNIQKPSQAQLGSLLGWSSVMQYPKAQPKCSTEILTSVNG